MDRYTVKSSPPGSFPEHRVIGPDGKEFYIDRGMRKEDQQWLADRQNEAFELGSKFNLEGK